MKKYIIIGTPTFDETIYFDGKLYRTKRSVEAAFKAIAASWEAKGYKGEFVKPDTLLLTDDLDFLSLVYKIFEF